MHTVMVFLHSADLGKVMSAMRVWLDGRHAQPSIFRYEAVGYGALLLKLDFVAAEEAKDFALEFRPHQRSRGSNPPIREGCVTLSLR